jgi:signal transduction histidine kinase
MVHLKRKIKSFLLKFFFRRLWVRIALLLLILVTVPVVLLGVLLINTSQKAVRNSVLTNHKQIVIRTAEEIGLFIKRPQDILGTTASLLAVVYPAPWKQETILVELVLNQPIFMRAVSVDSSGNELVSSELGRDSAWDYPREALESALRNKAYLSKVKVLDNHIPFVTMAVPIKKMGKPIAALIAEVSLRGMWQIVDNIKIGDTGRAFLVSDDGALIAHQDKKKVLRNENLKSQKEVQAVLAGKAEAIELEDKSEGKLISSYAPIPGLGWGVILRQKQSEAYLFSGVMKIQSWAIIILSELLAVLVSILMAKLLAQPIKTLAFRIKRVAEGDLEHKIKVGMRDEIGELIHSFNVTTKKLKKARDRERLSAIGEATSWILHELKNSFVSIKTFIQLFPQRHKDDKFVDKFNRLIPPEMNRLERMFKELSDFSSHYELRVKRINAKKIMDSILEMMREECAAKKIDLEYNAQNDTFYIEADPERLRQVFMNLLINSISAMPEGGLLTVSIVEAEADGLNNPAQIEVRIKDTGRGISRENCEQIFEPFRTTKNGGMGLGLSISRKIVQQHGGEIRVESKIDKGTTFIVRLPITVGMQRRFLASERK